MTRDEQTAISSAELQELVLPGMANHHGTLFAGLGLQLMAKAAFMAARKLARREEVLKGVFVMVAVDGQGRPAAIDAARAHAAPAPQTPEVS